MIKIAKLFFKYGNMNSGKSLLLLAAVHNYESQGKKIILLKPSLDTRSKTGMIESRVGISHDCIDIDRSTDILELLNIKAVNSLSGVSAIILDEGQFLTKEQVKQLAYICDEYDIPILVYGLKNSYLDSELFEGSAALLYYADKIEEIKTVCHCGRKSTMNLRILKGKPIYSGEIVNCGDTEEAEDYYIPVCRKHYYNPSK